MKNDLKTALDQLHEELQQLRREIDKVVAELKVAAVACGPHVRQMKDAAAKFESTLIAAKRHLQRTETQRRDAATDGQQPIRSRVIH